MNYLLLSLYFDLLHDILFTSTTVYIYIYIYIYICSNVNYLFNKIIVISTTVTGYQCTSCVT